MAEVKKQATREAYGAGLVELGAEYDNLLVLDADLAAATKTGAFKKAYPDRFFDCGIAEGNMMSIAAGLATTGKIVFASSFAMFAAGRAFEQVRNSIGYPHLNVIIGATHAGISVGEDGATHQCCEDIALMRTIPGMTIINPADATEAKKAVKAAMELDGPVYMRFGRLAVPVIFGDDYSFEIGKGVQLKDGNDVTVIATGLMVNEALGAYELLKNEGINARIINMHTIKPLDKEIVLKAAKETGAIVTAEEHSVIGGLGSAVSETVCEEYPVPVVKLGVNDTFGHSGPAVKLLDDKNGKEVANDQHPVRKRHGADERQQHTGDGSGEGADRLRLVQKLAVKPLKEHGGRHGDDDCDQRAESEADHAHQQRGAERDDHVEHDRARIFIVADMGVGGSDELQTLIIIQHLLSLLLCFFGSLGSLSRGLGLGGGFLDLLLADLERMRQVQSAGADVRARAALDAVHHVGSLEILDAVLLHI